MVITIIMETDHVYDLYGPCSCRGWASACPAVATEETLGHLTGSPTDTCRGPCGAGWLVSTKVGGVALVLLINWGTQVVAGETAFALVWGYIWENPTQAPELLFELVFG